MARIGIGSARARELVRKTVPLFLAAGSTAALAKMLSARLREDGKKPPLHPNRLHTLLSEDSSRGLNESTFELIEEAVGGLLADPRLGVKAEETAERLRAEGLKLVQYGGAKWEDVAARLGVPQAVLSELLPSPIQPGELKSSEVVAQPKAPDWSYQDVAVARCLDALTGGGSPRIGLILPTGAGKTRTALRIALFMLRGATTGGRVLWVTHRRNLRAQAHRELQKLLKSDSGQVPEGAAALLASRIDFVMVSEIGHALALASPEPVLVIIDEAHHAAASSYAPVLEPANTYPILLLTATPNRTDGLPIGIDEIAYTITYRELAERGAILRPKFLDFPVDDFDWSQSAIQDLADYVVERSAQEFTKVLVLAPRVDRVEEFYEALKARLSEELDHPLDLDDLGYIHGGRNSLGIDNEDFLSRFAAKPRAVVVSAQILLEGFDDPAVDTVIITYPTSSVIRLMQAAGRCVRFAPGKTAAYVVQARNDQIAYHFDHRWLYQEIDDFLRPELIDVEYGSHQELVTAVEVLLNKHNVAPAAYQSTLDKLQVLHPGDTCRVLLYGLPYYGGQESFATNASWGAFLETSGNSEAFRAVFNGFCAIGADISDPSDFLVRDGARHGITKDLQPHSDWMSYIGFLTAAYFAKREIYGPGFNEGWGKRPHQRNGQTTWLKYVSFSYRPAVPAEFVAFLADCHNALDVQARYLENKALYGGAVKIPLILGGSEAFLLSELQYGALIEFLGSLREELGQVEPKDQFAAYAGALLRPETPLLPQRLLARIEFLLGDPARAFSFKQPSEISIGDTV